jgi:integrase
MIATLDYQDICDKLSPLLFFGGAAFLLLTLVIGSTGKFGGKSWIQIPGIPLTIQPSEFVKLALIVTFAKHLEVLRPKLNHPLSVLRLLIHTGARCSTIETLRPCDMDDQWRLSLYNVKCDRRYSVKLPVNDAVIQALWDMCTCGLSPDKLIFDKTARRRLGNRMRRMFGKDYNGYTISPHSFRHLRCTQLARDGVHVSMAAKLLDASPQVLLRTYTTITQEDVDAMYSTPKSTPDSVSDVQTCNHTPEEKTASERKFRAPRRM